MKKIKKTESIKNIYLKTYLFGLAFSFLFLPFIALAATTYTQDLTGLFEYAKDIISDIVLWLFTTGAVLIFLAILAWKIYKGQQNSKERGDVYKYIVYGLIALTLMFTFYAVTGLLAVTFGIQIGIPQFFKSGDDGSGSGNVERSYSVISN